MIKVVCVVGATATGKSALAVSLAKAFDGEVISGDSAQVYRGMDVGTAKVTAEEMEGVPHHLIDVLDIDKPFSAGLFAQWGGEAARDIVTRGRLPIVAGGTGMYVDALTGPRLLSPTADSDPSVRAELMAKAEREGAEALHAYLGSIDPAAAAEIHPNNVKRVARAIEIYLVTGKTKTEHSACSVTQSEFSRALILLDDPDRESLYGRIDRRVDLMMEAGLLSEARRLWENGLGDTPTASAAIGYKEFFPYFEGCTSLESAVDKVKQASRNYAKRQITYFKRMKDAYAIDLSLGREAVFEKARDYVKAFLEN